MKKVTLSEALAVASSEAMENHAAIAIIISVSDVGVSFTMTRIDPDKDAIICPVASGDFKSKEQRENLDGAGILGAYALDVLNGVLQKSGMCGDARVAKLDMDEDGVLKDSLLSRITDLGGKLH